MNSDKTNSDNTNPDDPRLESGKAERGIAVNPYASAMPVAATVTTAGEVNFESLTKFRQQMHALGAFWIIIGGIVIGLVVYMLAPEQRARISDQDALIFVITGCLGAAWCVLGILTCVKQMWAVYTGLVLSYLSFIGNLINLNVCGLIILIAVILQAHRVISWSRQFRRAGVSIHASGRPRM